MVRLGQAPASQPLSHAGLWRVALRLVGRRWRLLRLLWHVVANAGWAFASVIASAIRRLHGRPPWVDQVTAFILAKSRHRPRLGPSDARKALPFLAINRSGFPLAGLSCLWAVDERRCPRRPAPSLRTTQRAFTDRLLVVWRETHSARETLRRRMQLKGKRRYGTSQRALHAASSGFESTRSSADWLRDAGRNGLLHRTDQQPASLPLLPMRRSAKTGMPRHGCALISWAGLLTPSFLTRCSSAWLLIAQGMPSAPLQSVLSSRSRRRRSMSSGDHDFAPWLFTSHRLSVSGVLVDAQLPCLMLDGRPSAPLGTSQRVLRKSTLGTAEPAGASSSSPTGSLLSLLPPQFLERREVPESVTSGRGIASEEVPASPGLPAGTGCPWADQCVAGAEVVGV